MQKSVSQLHLLLNLIKQLMQIIYWAHNDIQAMLPVQDGLQVQDDLSLMVVATGLPLLFSHRHEIP